MARKISVVNQKGGVGKTTTAVNLAVALAQRGEKVLLIDCDAQRNATQFLGLAQVSEADEKDRGYGTFEFVLGEGEFAPQRNVLVPGLDVVPSTRRTMDLELALTRHILTGPTRKLARNVARVEGKYGYLIADCGPTIGLVTANAIVACPEIVIPVETLPGSLLGVRDLQNVMEDLREAEPSIKVLGLLATLYEESGKLPKTVLMDLKADFGKLLFETIIHKAQVIAAAANEGRPIVLADPQSRGAREYVSFAKEVIARG